MDLLLESRPLAWPPAQPLSLQELGRDWHGRRLASPPRFALIEDPSHLWLVAARDQPFEAHPEAGAGAFQAELWRHDVAELFVAQSAGPRYLEFNLAPTGAWWMASFEGPRQPGPTPPRPEVVTHGAAPGQLAWQAALGIPLAWLRSTIGWGPASRLNVTLILESPQQRFLSACDLGGGEPDFHRPQLFPTVRRLGREMS